MTDVHDTSEQKKSIMREKLSDRCSKGRFQRNLCKYHFDFKNNVWNLMVTDLALK